MTIEAIIEKGPDGLYGIRSETVLGRTCLGGFGESVEEARLDFKECIAEAVEDAQTEGITHISPEEINIKFKYDLPSFFNYFEFINTSKFAVYAGINESKMRQYKNGLAYPSEKTTRKIMAAIKRIGSELSMAML
ncbi:MAG: pilus assembly protein HicB [Bacteroidales bacterium]|nr:pilus assembly protein HicB [Bacteroidales bacterium]